LPLGLRENDANSAEQSEQQSANTAGGYPHWYYNPEWWLAIVALPSIGLLWGQWKATANAANAASESASAAKDSAKIIISKERARLRLASPTIHLIDGVTRRSGLPRACEQIMYRIDCLGTTDAFVIRGRAGSWLSDSDGHFLSGWRVVPLFPLPTVIKAGGDGLTQSEIIDPITEYMVENTPPGTFQKLILNLSVQVEYSDVFQTKTHWKMTEKYSWRLTYLAKDEGFFSWEGTPEKHYTEQEEAN
jgi:hypothetical protein